MSKNLGTTFLELSPHDQVSLTTIRIISRQDIQDIVAFIDSYYDPAFIFFAYEILDTRHIFGQMNNSSDYFYQIVSKQSSQPQALQHLFEATKKCEFLKTQSLSILDLYEHLSRTSFRVYNKVLFKRLRLPKSQALSGARNFLTRMHFFQDVFCLNNLDDQRKFIVQIQQPQTRLTRIYKSTNNSDSDEQRTLQSYLTGSFSKDVQIYLPQQQREVLFEMMETKKAVLNVDNEMKDCTIDVMDIEVSQDVKLIGQLIESLKVKAAVEKKLKGLIDSDLEQEKQRSREKYRRIY